MRISSLSCLLLSLLLLLTIDQPASAGFLDGLVEKTKKSVQKAIEDPVDKQVDQAFKTGKGETSPDPAEGAGEPPANVEPNEAPSAPSAETSQNNNWKNTQTYSDDAARQMPLFEAPPGSPSVLDVPLKGIRLGMPVRIADQILQEQGFEYISHKALYRKEVRNINGEIRVYTEEEQLQSSRSGQGRGDLLERYLIEIHATEVSKEMMAELDSERQAWIAEAHEMKAGEPSGNQASAYGRRSYDARQDRMNPRQGGRQQGASQSATYFTGQPVKLISAIEYRQLYYGNQRFDYEAAKAQAEQVFGPQNYTNESSAYRRGAAYKTSSEHQLVYADVLLVPAAEREALVLQADPNAQYGTKMGMSHPCSAVKRNACVGVAAASAFPGNLEKQLEYARLKYAPYMIVNHDTGKGMKITQGWVYLGSGDTLRRYFAEKEKRAAQPVAAPSF